MAQLKWNTPAPKSAPAPNLNTPAPKQSTAVSLPTGIRSLTPKDPVAKLNAKYNGVYIPQLKAAGTYHARLGKQIYSYDLKRIKAGRAPLTTMQWINAYHAIHKGQGLVKEVSGGGGGGLLSDIGHVFSSAVSDVGNIAASLNPIRAIPAIDREIKAVIDLPHELASGQVQVHSLSDVLSLPGVRDIPGAFTLHNVVSGDWANIANHPIMTMLDVLPYTHAITHAAAMAKLDTIARGSEEASILRDAASKLQAVKNTMENITRTNPRADVSKANFLQAEYRKATQNFNDAQAAFDKVLHGTKVEPGTPLEAAVEGKPLKAAYRATGRDPIHAITQHYGLSSDVAEISRFNAWKLRGYALERTASKNAFADYSEKQGILKDLHDFVKSEKITTPSARAALKNAQASLIAARDTFVREVNKEMSLRIGLNYGKTIDDILPKGYQFVDGKILDGNLNVIKGADRRSLLATARRTSGEISLKSVAQNMGMDIGDISKLEKEAGFKLENISVPKWVGNAMRQMHKTDTNLFMTDMRKLTDIYRYSVVMRPQHFIHVNVFNAMMTLLEHPTAYSHFAEAFTKTRLGDWPAGMETLSSFTSPEAKVDSLLAVSQGKTLFRLFKSAVGGYAHNMRHTEEFINNFYRSMNYIEGYGKKLTDYEISRLSPTYERWGATVSDPQHLAGLESVRRTSLSMDAMTPVERNVIRMVIPFYPYTRKLFEFLGQFPHEHPLRAALIASLGRLEMSDWSTGLPSKFMDFFPVGAMDANGNQTMIDGKSINPFRGLNGYNPFTLAGFLSELNPALQAPVEMAGVNVLTATPDLYPQLSVDPRTGNLVAKPKDALPTLIETFLPPTQSIDALLGITQQYRGLKQNGGTEAQWRAIASSLGLTFAYPQTVNLMQERLKFANKEFSIGQTAEKSAMQTGTAPSTETTFPVRNQFLTQEQFQSLLDQAKAIRKSQGTNAPLSQYIGAG